MYIIKIYVEDTNEKQLDEKRLWSTHNICSHGEIRKQFSADTPLIWSYDMQTLKGQGPVVQS